MIEENPVNQILDEREQTFINESFGIGCNEMTHAEIGIQFGITADEVRRIREESVRKFRESDKINYINRLRNQ